MSQQEPPRHKIQLTWRPLGHLLTSMAFQLLTCGCSSGLIPTLSPPKNVIINGEKKTLVACLVKDLSEDALGAVWFSNGNGSMLPSSIYGISREEDGTFSAVSQISVSTQDFESWDAIVCYVAQNQTSQIWNTTSLQTSERNMGELCLDENQEVCKYVALELKSSFDETGKTKEVIDTKYGFLDGKASKIKYTKSDIRLIEVTENICKRLLEYNLHKERSGSNRFAKGMSETFETLHNLVHKGVKVVMDIPYELWNETSAEVADLKKQCEVMVEEYEDVIEDWYRNHQEEDISQFLCANHVLKGKDTSCLTEKWTGKKGDLANSGKKKAKKKESKGKKSSKSKKSQKDEVEQEKETMKPSASEGPDRAEEEEVVQKTAPLLHSTDEL